MGPFETLLDIEQNCKANTVKIPRQIVTEKDWLGIAFKASGFNFVCPMAIVTEVLRWPSVTELPSAAHWFKGTANLRGHILPVTDFQGFITNKPHRSRSLSRVLVITLSGVSYGFAVEQVIGIERFFSEEKKPLDGIDHIEDYLPYVEGAFERNEKPWLILNMHAVIESTEFYHIVSFKRDYEPGI